MFKLVDYRTGLLLREVVQPDLTAEDLFDLAFEGGRREPASSCRSTAGTGSACWWPAPPSGRSRSGRVPLAVVGSLGRPLPFLAALGSASWLAIAVCSATARSEHKCRFRQVVDLLDLLDDRLGIVTGAVISPSRFTENPVLL